MTKLTGNTGGAVQQLIESYLNGKDQTFCETVTYASQVAGTVIGIARISCPCVLLGFTCCWPTLRRAPPPLHSAMPPTAIAPSTRRRRPSPPRKRPPSVGLTAAMGVAILSGIDSQGLPTTYGSAQNGGGGYEDIILTTAAATAPASGTLRIMDPLSRRRNSRGRARQHRAPVIFMAAGDSIVGICNLGLVNGLGQDPISALSDNRKAAIHCNISYDPVRRAVLRAHPWDFATTRRQISASATPPPFGYANAYQLPADFIRIVAVGDDTNQEHWKDRKRLHPDRRHSRAGPALYLRLPGSRAVRSAVRAGARLCAGGRAGDPDHPGQEPARADGEKVRGKSEPGADSVGAGQWRRGLGQRRSAAGARVMRQDVEITDFTGGELSPKLKGRTDLKKYFSSCATMLNMVVMPQGGATKRPPTLYVANNKNQAGLNRPVRFVFSTVQAYVLEFSNSNVRIYANDGWC
jgi:hypothetical protein